MLGDMIMGNKSLYYLMSINIISYIRANGIEPIGLPEKTSDNKIKYYFEDTIELKRLLDQYHQDIFLQNFINKLKLTKQEMQEVKK
jgi:UTP-glucose-1-phosphate uridylyltransferase